MPKPPGDGKIPSPAGSELTILPRLGAHAPTGQLLELDRSSGGLELRLGLLGVFLRDLLEHRLRRRVDEVLRLLQTKARERTNLLDDLDLLVASSGQDDVELVLLLGRSLGTPPPPPAAGAAATARAQLR